MKIGPKYKIAKRLGAGVFEKTSGTKFALASERKNFSLFGTRSRSNYGNQLLEKQKVRFTYGITERQLSNYVKKVISSKSKTPEEELYKLLEKRLDNVVLRSGFASTRFQARQMVSHGHIRINDKKMTVPSHSVKKDDVITIKESSREKGILIGFEERSKDLNVPVWLKLDPKAFSVIIIGDPSLNPSEANFNLSEVLQFYKR
jgi:small subunit ribosomal protein S4